MSADKHVHDSNHVASMSLWLRRVITNPDGSVAFDSGEQPASSCLLQYMKFWWHYINHAMSVMPVDEGTVVDTSNAARVLEGTLAASSIAALIAPAGTSTYGVVVGSGNEAEANDNYHLQTQIVHGVGAGQLQYGAISSSEPVIAGANVDWVITRAFTNGSGNDVAINEIGIYLTCNDSSAVQRYFCVVRDVLSTTDTVQNGQTDTITYTLRTTV